MEGLLVMFLIWGVIKFLATRTKYSQDNRAPAHKRAVEEQRRRREAFEAAQQQGQPFVGGEGESLKDLKDAILRQAELELKEAAHREQAARAEALRRRQAAKALMRQGRGQQEPAAQPERHHIDEEGDERCAAITVAREQQRKRELREGKKAAPPPLRRVPVYNDTLVRGIVMAEILGPPRSKRMKTGIY